MQTPDGQVLIRAAIDTDAVTRGINEMKLALQELRTYAQRQLSAVRRHTEQEGNAMTGSFSALASRLIGALHTGLSGGRTSVGSVLRGVLTTALNAGLDAAPRFSSVGGNVISGIISGIRSASSALWNTLRSVAERMLSTLRGALDIRSPSRVMRDEIGAQIGAGIAQGILDGRAAVEKAAASLARAASDMHLTLPLTTSLTASPITSPTAVPTEVPTAAPDPIPAPTAAAAPTDQLPPLPREGYADVRPPQPQIRSGAAEMTAAAKPMSADVFRIGAAEALLRAAMPIRQTDTAVRTAAATDGGGHSDSGTAHGSTSMNNTFVFNKPVETPYRHARAIRETMEEMLYGV